CGGTRDPRAVNLPPEARTHSSSTAVHCGRRTHNLHRLPRRNRRDRHSWTMPNNLAYDLQQLGFLARTTQLAARGHGRRRIENAVASGHLKRVCRGWVATTQASRTAVIAVLQRGKLTGPTALASYGIWDAVDRHIHVQLRHNRHGPAIAPLTPLVTFHREKYLRVGVQRHWAEEQHPEHAGAAWRVSAMDALVRVALD